MCLIAPQIAAVLLHELAEYNGRNMRLVPVHNFHEMTDLDCPGSDQPGDIEDLLVS